LNRAWAAVGSAGFSSGLLVTLEVIGRNSGNVVALPLVVTVVDGERYFVSMLGNDAAWVKNVRAANGHATLRSGGREPVLLEELAASERPSILRAYLQRAPGARAHIPVDKNAGLTEFEQIASAYPV